MKSDDCLVILNQSVVLDIKDLVDDCIEHASRYPSRILRSESLLSILTRHFTFTFIYGLQLAKKKISFLREVVR